jgi:hypothetical protein
MKHRINVLTGLCSKCGLSVSQKLTTECVGHQLRSDVIKLIVNGELDYANGNWINLKLKQSKPSIKINGDWIELPLEVSRQTLSELIHNLSDTADTNLTKTNVNEELAKEMAEVFGKAFKERDTKIQLDEFELDLLNRIKQHPLPFTAVANLELTLNQVTALMKFKKYGLVNLLDDYYEITIYGDNFLVKPEVFITDTELAFMLCCQHDGYPCADVTASKEAWDTYQSLRKKGLIKRKQSNVILTPSGNDHIAKLCAIPL